MWKLEGAFDSQSGRLELKRHDSSNIVIIDNHIVHGAFSGRLVNHGPSAQRTVEGQEAELLVAAYLGDSQFGFLNEWSGNFSFVLYDSRCSSLLLGADVYGTFPLFYRKDRSGFSFSSEYEDLLEVGNNDLDVDAISEFLTLGTVLGTKTFIKQISSIQSGCIVELSNRGIKNRKASDFSFRAPSTFSELTTNVTRAISASVKDHVSLYGDRMEVDLSGGLDTRLIASCIDREKLPIKCFQTCYTPPLNEHNDKDVIIAKSIASRTNYPIQVGCMPMSEKMDCLSFLKTFNSIEPSTTLKGIMGGELLNADAVSFIQHDVLSLLRQAENDGDYDSLWRNAKESGIVTRSIECQALMKELFGHGASSPIEQLIEEVLDYPKEANKVMWYIYQSFVRSFVCDIYCESSYIWMTPHKFMTKVCSPFLDRRLLDIILTVSPSFVQGSDGHALYGSIYKNFFPQFLNIPTNSNIGKLDHSEFNYFQSGVDRKSLPSKSIIGMFHSNRLKEEAAKWYGKDAYRYAILDGWLRYRDLLTKAKLS